MGKRSFEPVRQVAGQRLIQAVQVQESIHHRYNLGGTEFIVWADGANHATKYDGTTVTDLNATGAPANPKFVTGLKDTVFCRA